MEHYFNDGTEPTILRQPRIPLGCDEQGRHPQAAEAATEIGIPDEPEHDMLKVIATDVLRAVTAICALCIVVLLALRGL
jgi:hypothetical protein